jgi:aminomethyltransferase
MRFGERYGIEVPLQAADARTEYTRIRETVGITDFSHVQVYRVPEESGIDFLDTVLAGNVARVRYGRVLHTFLADAQGMLQADCYVANGDEEFFVVCESIVDDAAMDAVFQSPEAIAAGCEKLTGSVVALSIDGFRAWAVVKELFGTDVLGLPYLSLERYTFGGEAVQLIRAGKTSEFGYLLMAPITIGAALLEQLHLLAEKNGGGLCGVAIHGDLRLEGRFFNIYAEGLSVRDPLVLGLQWMIDFDKGTFRGGDAIHARREAGLSRKLIGVAGQNGADVLAVGSTITDSADTVADVVASCWSYTLDCRVALAVFARDYAYSGLTLRQGGPEGPEVSTISMPPIVPRSLTVRLDEL